MSLVFLATTLPLVGWAMTQGGVGFARVAITLLVMAALLGAVCALAATTTTRTVTQQVPVIDETTGQPIPGQTRQETFAPTDVRPDRAPTRHLPRGVRVA